LRILERSIELTVKSNQSNTEVACLRNQLTQVKLPMTEVNIRHGPRLNAQGVFLNRRWSAARDGGTKHLKVPSGHRCKCVGFPKH